MNFPFKKRVLSQEQHDAAIEYVESTFGAVPKPPSADHMQIVDFLSGEMDKSDLSAWIGHLMTTPAGLFALARIKFGFGAPTTGLQWLGMQLFIDSCVILIDKGYPPAGADLSPAHKVVNAVDGASTRDGRYHGSPPVDDDYEGHPLG